MKPTLTFKLKSCLPVLFLSLSVCFCSKDETKPSICHLSSYSGTYSGTYTYANNRLNASTEYGVSATYSYDQKGNIVTINYTDGSVENYVYDNSNRKTELTRIDQYQLKYTYNTAGQLTLRQLYLYEGVNKTYVLSSYLTFLYATSDSKNWNELDKFDGASKLLITSTFQYDTKHNPWADVWGTSSVETANNPVQQVYTPQGGAPETTTIVYTYNSNGYPVTATTTGASTTTATYSYADCQ